MLCSRAETKLAGCGAAIQAGVELVVLVDCTNQAQSGKAAAEAALADIEKFTVLDLPWFEADAPRGMSQSTAGPASALDGQSERK